MRWDNNKHENVERLDVDKFIEAIILVYHKYEMSISHEDYHGSFRIEKFSEDNVEWLREASVNGVGGA